MPREDASARIPLIPASNRSRKLSRPSPISVSRLPAQGEVASIRTGTEASARRDRSTLVTSAGESVGTMKGGLVLCDAATVALLWFWLAATGRDPKWTLAYAWNPLVTLEGARDEAPAEPRREARQRPVDRDDAPDGEEPRGVLGVAEGAAAEVRDDAGGQRGDRGALELPEGGLAVLREDGGDGLARRAGDLRVERASLLEAEHGPVGHDDPVRVARRRDELDPEPPGVELDVAARVQLRLAAAASRRRDLAELERAAEEPPRLLIEGLSERRGSITKAGNAHVRRLLIEAAWHQRHRPVIAAPLRRRREGQPARVIALADRASERLHRRYIRMSARGKPLPKVVVALARELTGFIWATLHPHAEALEARG